MVRRAADPNVEPMPPRDPLGHFDPPFVRGLIARFGPAVRAYFRAEVSGLERVPAGRAMIVGNHNAGITFPEPFLFGAAWYERPEVEPLHFLTHDAMLGLPGLGRLLRRLGSVRASPENAHRILASDRKLVVFPGGDYEGFRPYRERHRVDFGGRTGFARLALQTGAPIVPLACVGGHETFVVLRRGERLARLLRADRLLRSKAWPVMLTVPWGLTVGPIFHLPLPAKCVLEVGEPIPPAAAGPGSPGEREAALSRLVTARLQAMVDRLAARRRLPVLG